MIGATSQLTITQPMDMISFAWVSSNRVESLIKQRSTHDAKDIATKSRVGNGIAVPV